MILTLLQRALWLAALVVAQMMVFNHIHFMGYATPLPFVYLVMLFPMGANRSAVMLWGFTCGLLTDIVSLTPGIGAAAMTLAACIQPPLATLMAPKDAVEDLQPSMRTLGFWPYFRYALIITGVFTIAYFALTAFNFFHLRDLAIATAASWALTLAICLLMEALRSR
ncbi:MAG: rod shape-determining protein MreD [Bacteroidaceae bacterium]|nr:rod shape-determining protein MreD [Bacteroidaceae bacterium]